MIKEGMRVRIVKRNLNEIWTEYLKEYFNYEFKVISIKENNNQDLIPEFEESKYWIMVDEFIGYFPLDWFEPVMGDGQCPCVLCGWPSELGFNLAYCSNPECKNYEVSNIK